MTDYYKNWQLKLNLLEASKIVVLIFLMIFCFGFFVQDTKAATDGRFSFLMTNGGNFIEGCEYSTDILVETGTNDSSSADIIIDFDPAKIDIVDADDLKSGTQIKTGNAYQSYFGNVVDESAGIIRLTGASFDEPFHGSGIFSTILFRSKANITSADFKIRFTGASATNSTDSNIAIAQPSLDALGSVGNASMTFIKGSCLSDTTPPEIIFVNPINNEVDFTPTDPVNMFISDNMSGVNLSTLEILINGVPYTVNDSSIQVSGNPNNYSLIINQNSIFTDGPSSIFVKVQDFAGNFRQSYISFNFVNIPVPTSSAGEDKTPPIIKFITPVSRQTIGNSTVITFSLHDEGKGINRDSLQFYINEKKYTLNDSNVKIEGDQKNYTVFVTDNFDFPKTSSSYLSVSISDLDGNNTLGSIIFNIPEAQIIEDMLKRGENPICTPTDVAGPVDGIPFDKEVNTIQTRVEGQSPTPLQPAIRQIGILGFISILMSLPLLVWLVSILIGFALGGFLLPFLKALFIKHREKKFGRIIDRLTRRPVPFVEIIVWDLQLDSEALKDVSDRFGRFYITLRPGKYKITFIKHGFKEFNIELELEEKTTLMDKIELRKMRNLSQKISELFFKLKINPRLVLVYSSFALAFANILYTRTLAATIILLVMTLTAFYVTIKSKTKIE